jgi:hypothetical protein
MQLIRRTASDCEVVPYQADFRSQVIELQTHLWSPSLPLNDAYFEWKFLRNPYQRDPLIYLALVDGKAVGMRSFCGVKWEAGVPAQNLIAPYADDAVIEPAFRNSGLMPAIMKTALADLALSGHPYVFNLSAGPITFLTSISMGWRSAGYVQPMHWRSRQIAATDAINRVLSPFPRLSGQVKRLRKRCVAKGFQTFSEIEANRIHQLSTEVPNISFQDLPRCQEMANLVKRLGHTGLIRHVRDSAYFDWRFQNPLSRYRFLFYDSDRLDGYLVLHEYVSEFAQRDLVNIVDWEAANTAIKSELLQAAIKLLPNRRIDIWSATMSEETIALLVQNHFKSERQEPAVTQQAPGILVRATNDTDESTWMIAGRKITELANWDLRMLFSMRG